jgi:glycosyltransferase involved in cell wall biosynthesis
MDNTDQETIFMPPISDAYLLSVCVPIIIDENGVRWCGELWAKDLALHLNYLTNVTVACPRIFAKPTELDVPLNVAPFDRLQFIDLPAPRNHVDAIGLLPEMLWKMWRGIRKSTIIHTGFGGWPISEGWLAVPIGKLQGKFIITNVESSFWRAKGPNIKWYQRVRGTLAEHLNRYCVNVADLRLFTSKAYANEFLKKDAKRAYVVPATWIDEARILSQDQASAYWASKTGDTRLLFAGKLISDKGVKVLIDAIHQVARKHAKLAITIIGDGPFRSECVDLVGSGTTNTVSVEILEPVKYGEAFFNLLRGYDAVLVPSLSDEQPRVIFDAFSQAVPVLGSATGGICEVVDHQFDGRLFSPGDVDAFARDLFWASDNRYALQIMGMHALAKCRRFTHRSMHKTRHCILLKELNIKQN